MHRITSLLLLVALTTLLSSCSRQNKPAVAFVRTSVEGSPSARDFEVFQQTQMSLIESTFVLNQALREIETINSDLLGDLGPQPISYLQEHLTMTTPGKSEIVRIELTGFNSEHGRVEMLGAIVNSYLAEVATAERTEFANRLQLLREVQRRVSEQLKENLESVHQLSKEIGTSDSQLAKLDTEIQLEEFRVLNRRVNALQDLMVQSKITEAQERIAHEAVASQESSEDEENADPKLSVAQAEAATRVVSEQLAAAQRTLDAHVSRMRAKIGYSTDLELKKVEQGALKERLDDLSAKIAQAESELQRPSRVSLVQPAIIP